MATNSSILAWRIPWPEEPGELQCRGPASAGSRGYPQDEWRRQEREREREREREKTRETSLDRAKSARERERKRVTRSGVQSLADSGNALFFTIDFIP